MGKKIVGENGQEVFGCLKYRIYILLHVIKGLPDLVLILP